MSPTPSVRNGRPSPSSSATSSSAVGSRARLIHVPGATVPLVARVLGLALHDVLLTGDEYRAMAAGLADTDGPATGTTALSVWLADHGPSLGLRYANEIARHYEHTP